MANVLVEESNLSNIAQAIRSQNGGDATYKPNEMAAAISNLPVTTGTQAFEDTLIQGNFSNYSYENDRVTHYRTSVFSNCPYTEGRSGLKSVSLPSLSNIVDGSFSNTQSLTQINLPELKSIIGSNTFSFLPGMTAYSFPKLEWIQGNHTFAYNSNLTSIDFPLLSGGQLSRTFINDINLTSVNLSNFWGNDTMRDDGTNYHMGALGPATFYGCSNLASIQFSTTNRWSISNGQGLFEECESLTTLDLSTLELGWGQSSIVASGMFSSCSNLSNITFDRRIEFSSTSRMFLNCSALTKLKLPSMPISYQTFCNTSNLKTLIFDSNIHVGTSSSPLVPLEYTFNNAFLKSGMLEDDAYIYVPKVYLSNYQTATNWVTVANKFRAIEDYPDITGGES